MTRLSATRGSATSLCISAPRARATISSLNESASNRISRPRGPSTGSRTITATASSGSASAIPYAGSPRIVTTRSVAARDRRSGVFRRASSSVRVASSTGPSTRAHHSPSASWAYRKFGGSRSFILAPIRGFGSSPRACLGRSLPTREIMDRVSDARDVRSGLSSSSNAYRANSSSARWSVASPRRIGLPQSRCTSRARSHGRFGIAPLTPDNQ